ncbi:MAG: radical SAM protein [Nitrospirae bacterium]|nr:radical SAM protein [Nitrospirota bacterium]
MSTKPNLIVPVFIPHHGCPHRCVFCNQSGITGQQSAPTPDEVREYLSRHLSKNTPHAVVAFYGGSFTGLPLSEQEGYLSAAREFIRKGHANGIRLSTRPDYIHDDTPGFLKSYGVEVVELGVQSMDDRVLAKSARGHAAADTVRASGLIKDAGLELGIQVMPGMPGDTPEGFIETVRRVIDIKPHIARIYPVLVIAGSPLELVWRRGEYVPLGIDDAVELSAKAVTMFREAGIKVVRVGLQPGRELEDSLLAGPYHPAFGHMVESAIALSRMQDALLGYTGMHDNEAVEFLVNPAELSVYKGIRRANEAALARARGGLGVRVKADAGVAKGEFRLVASRGC